jgi:FlaA1/EpsC-like NDP-sugar epimerase
MKEKSVQVPTSPHRIAPALQKYWSAVRRIAEYQVVRRLRRYGISVMLDILTVAAAFIAATALRFIGTPRTISEVQYLLLPNLLIGATYAAIAYLLGLHRRLWRYASLRDGFVLMQAVGVTMVLIGGLNIVGLFALQRLPLSVFIGGAFLSFLFLGCVKMLPRVIHTSRAVRSKGNGTRVLIVGAGQAGATLAARLLLNGAQGYRVVAFIDDDPAKWHRRIHGKPILGPIDTIPTVVKDLAIDLIAIALPSAGTERISEIITVCQQTTASIKILPGLQEIIMGQAQPHYLREVNVADLLGRAVVPLQAAAAHAFLEGRVILVTGAAGSIGSELCRQLIGYGPATLIALDTNETGLFDLAESLRAHPHAARLRLRIGDITDLKQMSRLFAVDHPQLVFHAAAYKHVPLLESHVDQAIRTNVLATYQLCRLTQQYNVCCFVFISSDKAAEPVSVLGASKRVGEMIVQAMAQERSGTTRFCAVRFGNVIGSRGSVVPLFTQQIQQGGPITVTDPAATRYFMTIAEACGLVILTATMRDSQGLFLLDMGTPVRISDLAVKMIRLHGLRVEQDIPITYTGLRPGERLHETLTAPEETLLPTAYSKIFCVSPRGGVPPFTTMDREIHVLQEALGHADNATLRECLFSIIQPKIPV